MSSKNKLTGWMTAVAMGVCTLGGAPALAASGNWTADILTNDGRTIENTSDMHQVLTGGSNFMVMLGHDALVEDDDRPSMVLLGYDARQMDEDRPSMVLLGADARQVDEDRPSMVMLGYDAKQMDDGPKMVLLGADARQSDSDTPSMVMLGYDARQSDSDCMVLLGSDAIIGHIGNAAGMMISASGSCDGQRAYVPAEAFHNDLVLLTTSVASTFTADVMDILVDQGFNFDEINAEAITQAAAGVEMDLESAIISSSDMAVEAISRYDNGDCGAGDLEATICNALAN